MKIQLRPAGGFALLAGACLFSCKAANPTLSEARPAKPAAESVVADSTPLDPGPENASVALPVTARVPEPVIARIGEDKIYVSELLSTWMLVDGAGLRDMLGTLVTTHLVARESERLGITLDESMLNDEFALRLGEMERRLQAEQPGMRLDEWIAGGLGLDPVRFRQGLRDDIQNTLLTERVVRFFILSQDNAEVAVIVCETRELAEAAAQRVRDGEPFGRIAGELSIDPSGKTGGRIPPVVRNESALARLAFNTPEAELGGPLEEGGKWLILKTNAIHEPLTGTWSTVSEAVEASLRERSIEEPEYWLWKSEMNARQPADFEPFFDLIGEAGDRRSL